MLGITTILLEPFIFGQLVGDNKHQVLNTFCVVMELGGKGEREKKREIKVGGEIDQPSG